MNLQQFRDLFPAYTEGIYVNHAAVSPFSEITRKTLDVYQNKRSHLPVDVYPGILETKKQWKSQIVQLLNASSPDQIAFVPNTSFGLNMIATGLDWKPGDRILLNRMEFPSNIYPFMNLERLGVIIDWINVEGGQILPAAIESQMTSRTRMLSLSFVQFLNGFSADMESIGRICKAHDVLFVVDGIQGTGVIPIDVQKWQVDAWVAGGHKWLMWPMGTGFLYVQPDLLTRLHPMFAGWLSVKDSWNMLDYNLDFLETAEKFETGTTNFMDLMCAAAVLDHFTQIGIPTIQSRIRENAGILLEAFRDLPVQVLTPESEGDRSGIVSLKVENPESVFEALQGEKIIAAVRGDVLRFSPHCTNTPEEMGRIVEVMQELLK